MTPSDTPSRHRTRLVWVLVTTGLLLLAGANAHLVFVAIQSQPECVYHLKAANGGAGYRAAKSAC